MTAPGVGGAEPSKSTDQSQESMSLTPSGGSGMDTKVKTLADVKAALIQSAGEEKGTKLYNQFISSMETSLVIQSQASATRAQQAAKKMRET